MPCQGLHRQAGHCAYLGAVQPGPRAVRIDDDRHSVMDGVQCGSRRFGQDGAGQPLIVRQRDRRPQPGKQQRRRVARGVDVEGLFRAIGRLPLEITAGRHNAARALVGVTVAGRGCDTLDTRIDGVRFPVRERLAVPVRDQAPASEITGQRIAVAPDDRDHRGGRDIVA